MFGFQTLVVKLMKVESPHHCGRFIYAGLVFLAESSCSHSVGNNNGSYLVFLPP